MRSAGSFFVAAWISASIASAQTTQRVSVSSFGSQASNSSIRPSISGDGRYVAFESVAFDLVLETMETLLDERGEDDTIWGSMVKQALKRRKPGFNEKYYGFRSFNELLEEAKARNLLDLDRDEKSGGYSVHLYE